MCFEISEQDPGRNDEPREQAVSVYNGVESSREALQQAYKTRVNPISSQRFATGSMPTVACINYINQTDYCMTKMSLPCVMLIK